MSVQSHAPQAPQDGPPQSAGGVESSQAPAHLKNKPSRRSRTRSSLGNFVSRILPSRRAERGHTLRSEYKEDGPLTATDLVFGLSDPQDEANTEVPKKMEEVNASLQRTVQPYSQNIEGMVEAFAKDSTNNEWTVEGDHSIQNGKRAQNPALGLEPLMIPGHSEEWQNQVATQQQHPQFRIPSFKFKNEALGLDFQNDKDGERAEGELSKTQQIYAAKKARREQRRSLLESGDFLGIQGANPRTGYWDVSTGTSSSDPSQLSLKTRRQLEEQAKEVEEQRAKYEETQAKYHAELERAQSAKARREAEREEQKRRHLKLKQRKRGRWQVDENGWSSVAEPDLSPIGQSVAGTPVQGMSKNQSYTNILSGN